MGNKRRANFCRSRSDVRTTSRRRNNKKLSNTGQTTATATTTTTGKITTTTTTTTNAESTTTTTPDNPVDCRKRQCHHALPKLAMVFPFLTSVANLGKAKVFMISCFNLHCCFKKNAKILMKSYRIGADISTCTYKRNSAEFEILQFVNLFGYKYMYFYPGISTCTYIRKQIYEWN